MSAPTSTWNDFVQHFFHDETLGISLDTSRMQAPADLATRMEGPLREALQAMQDLEGGAIANPDEKRMVGHYWLRCPELAPSGELRRTIEQTNERVRDFVNQVHMAEVRGERDEAFTNFLLIGIGGSALGPQLVADALGTGGDQLVPHFMDNTDPDGIARTLDRLEGLLDRTLVVMISKSGGTPETRNGMLETQAAYARAGLKFARHAVAVTSDGSGLDKRAIEEHWLARFPMWDWVGGRTSVTSAVGLLPAALQGVDIEALLQGAAAMDELTRKPSLADNPALLLALMWHYAGDGKGKKDMVILPYKDRLLLLSKYLQQLIMESLGKEKDTRGNVVNQGIAVYGNKGSTDQHAYVQQLREGLNNFFATFIEVLQDDAGSGTDELAEVEPGVFSGDYLQGFFLGTRTALADMGRGSITITIRRLDARSLGMLIALFERAVGFYATLVGINAYHQPGVEAGKKAAAEVLGLQQRLLSTMGESTGASRTALSWAEIVGALAQAETIFKLLERLAANPGRGVIRVAGKSPAEHTYRRV